MPDARWIEESEVIFVGEVVGLGAAPREYSGGFVSYQTVTYRVLRVLKGILRESEPKVSYPISGNKEIEEKDRPALSPDYFRSGRIFLNFASYEQNKHTGTKLVRIASVPHSKKAEVWIKSKLQVKTSQ